MPDLVPTPHYFAEYLPLSLNDRDRYQSELDQNLKLFRGLPRIPLYSKRVGSLLSLLRAYEVACQFFQFSALLQSISTIDGREAAFIQDNLQQFEIGNRAIDDVFASFILIVRLSPQEALLAKLMDSMGMAEARRAEFVSEFKHLATRYLPPPPPPSLPAQEIAKVKSEKKPRPSLDWQAIILPNGLTWPSRSYSAAAKLGISIIEHLETEWKDLIAAGIATRQLVEAVDPTTLSGIENFRYLKSSKRPEKADRIIPDHLLPLTKKQALDRAIMDNPALVLTNPRVVRTLTHRVNRAHKRKKRTVITLTANPS